jgi:SecD/SecF fusion protein
MTDRQRNVFVLLLVAGLIAASAVVLATKKTFLGLDLKGGTELVYKGEPTPKSPVNATSLSRAVDIMRQRVDQLGVSQPSISTQGSGANGQIVVQLPDVQDTARAEATVGKTAQLFFYDWEANAITPNGKTVASQLLAQDPSATAISAGASTPGVPGAGSTGLYNAVLTASKQPFVPAVSGNRLSRYGNVYYLFGKGGTPACAAAARVYGVVEAAAPNHCLLNGPVTLAPNSSQSAIQAALTPGLPAGVTISQGQILEVPQGTVVLQAVPTSFASPPKAAAPNTQYFVLKDDVALRGTDITNPQQSTDTGGNPDVSFGFTSTGTTEFQNVTGTIAKRGQLDQPAGATQENQHFAVALDNLLVTVPSIDYKTYPAGIPAGQGADITGGFTIQSAQDLATQLRLGALPIKLVLISSQQVSATLGKQSLHQGLIAGGVGLLVVALFLLLYYRLLGLIAIAGLAVYALYFYALIKLIPITMTLAGIAGMILTIGVAADANIVIFERVKEEIRAGRNIRQGIAIGYRKGLTAIIDANVVTIMTAFILFVLATADVKGFAFTLGIGVFVSLFTAVMATQAILGTMGNSRHLSRPSMLGAGQRKRFWRYDFMGASRYFFTMSGVILLVGALAVGGRGLNLGIDFTSGTRITTGLVADPTAQQVANVVTSVAAKSTPTVQVLSGDKTIGGRGYQISSKNLGPNQVQAVKSALIQRYGVRNNDSDFSSTSVGPTFGSTVTNSAVTAIIASLIVISLYVALRFEWKFAVPVLIALMHDLLITSGVYALTGKEVTADTVAALLTILGYSLYDTIIVFDRVRENIPRMPRAAFSQIVNRSMSEVLTRSLATTSCTLLPVIALLIFGGSTLKDFAFALLIGVASGAYSSIFIASPVLTHWKEREHVYRARRQRIEGEFGHVPPFADAAADVDPTRPKTARRSGRLTEPEPETVSAAEFEQMKRDLDIERGQPSRHTSTLTRRLARADDEDEAPAQPRPNRAARRRPARPDSQARPASRPESQERPAPAAPSAPAAPEPPADQQDGAPAGEEPVTPAPDIAENEGMVPAQKPKPRSKSRNRRHGRRR